MTIRREHIEAGSVKAEDIVSGAVTTEKLASGAVTREKTASTFIQSGATAVSFPFAAAGVERVSANITFPTPFPAGVIPRVVASLSTPDLHLVGITAISETGFTVVVSDTAGVDKTAAVTATVYWIAIAP